MLLRLFGGSDLSLGVALIYSLLGIVIVFLVLAFLILVISIMAKITGKKKQEAEAPAPAGPAEPEAPVFQELAKGSCGGVNLFDVDDRTAAMLMAIVADKVDRPLNELRFISIKEIEE